MSRSRFAGRPMIANAKRNSWWQLQQRHQFWNEELTPENRQFTQDVVEETYRNNAEMTTTSPLKEPPPERAEWHQKMRRSGLIARKIGVQRLWRTDGTNFLATLLEVPDNHVIKCFSPEEFQKTNIGKLKGFGRYGCVVVGADSMDPTLTTAEYNGLFAEAGVQPKKKLTRFTVTRDALLQPGTPLQIQHFTCGQYVDLMGVTIWKGFQGVMKRWGFAGGRGGKQNRTKSHRRPGTICHGRHLGVVIPGKKMAGVMGGEFRMLRGARIVRINYEDSVLYVNSQSIAGPTNSWVYVKDTILGAKRPIPKPKRRTLGSRPLVMHPTTSVVQTRLKPIPPVPPLTAQQAEARAKRLSERRIPPVPTFYPGDEENEESPRATGVGEEFLSEVHQFDAPTITFKLPDKKKRSVRRRAKR